MHLHGRSGDEVPAGHLAEGREILKLQATSDGRLSAAMLYRQSHGCLLAAKVLQAPYGHREEFLEFVRPAFQA
jgi:hypothetical protein